MPSISDSELIDRLGGTVATAELCRVVPQAVSQWRRNGIPSARRMFLELARPELFSAAGAAEHHAAHASVAASQEPVN